MSEYAAPPADRPVPRSRGGALLRGVRAKLVQWVRWDECPTPEAFREVCRQRDAAVVLNRRQAVELAEARASADAAEAEVRILAAVIERDRERVARETAVAAAGRERSLSEAASATSARRE